MFIHIQIFVRCHHQHYKQLAIYMEKRILSYIATYVHNNARTDPEEWMS